MNRCRLGFYISIIIVSGVRRIITDHTATGRAMHNLLWKLIMNAPLVMNRANFLKPGPFE